MAKAKILIVDDDKAITTSLSDEIVSAGFEAIAAKDGKEGLVLALAGKPELLIVDLEMPVMGGMEMIKQIRGSGDWGKKVPVIILTNYDTNKQIMEGVLENEPSFYLLKSETNPETIVDKIREKLGPDAALVQP